MTKDTLIIGGHEFQSRFILGSGKYSMKLIEAAVKDAGAEIITMSVRRANTKEHENILDYIPEGVTLLPNSDVVGEDYRRCSELCVDSICIYITSSELYYDRCNYVYICI